MFCTDSVFRMEVLLSLVFLTTLMTVYGNNSGLKRDVFLGYEKEQRPECGRMKAVNVTIDNTLSQIQKLDEHSQILSTNIWITMSWNDCRLMWNETQYGTTYLLLPATEVWIPHLMLFESVSTDVMKDKKVQTVKITFNGDITLTFYSTVHSFCELRLTYFPFDIQTCLLSYGSDQHDSSRVDFLPSVKNESLRPAFINSAWKVRDFSAQRREEQSACCRDPITTVTYSLVLERRSLFYVVCLVLPYIIVAALTLLGFLLPVECGEKVTLQVIVMLSLFVLLLMMANRFPSSSASAPILGVYAVCTIFLVGLSCVVTVFVLRTHFKRRKRVPRWIRKHVFGKLGPFVCATYHEPREEEEVVVSDYQQDITENDLPSEEEKEEEKEKSEHSFSPSFKPDSNMEQPRPTLSQIFTDMEKEPPERFMQYSSIIPPTTPEPPLEEPKVKTIVKEIVCKCSPEPAAILRRIDNRDRQRILEAQRAYEWQHLAVIIDRFFFFVCSLFLFLVTLALFAHY